MITGNEYFTVEIETENDMFQDGKGFELAIILRQLANRIEMIQMDDGDEYNLQDSNGNSVGKAKFFVKKPEPRSTEYNRYEIQ